MLLAKQIVGFQINYCPRTINEIVSFFACWYKFTQLECWSKIFWLGMVKNGCDQSGLWTPKLIISQEWTDGTNLIFCILIQIDKNRKLIKNGRDQPGFGTLKLTLKFKKWTDGINWVFACWYKFRNSKSWFNVFWVDTVKNDHDLVVHETLESAVSY